MDSTRNASRETFEVDDSHWPVLRVTFTGSPDDTQFEAYLQVLEGMYERHCPVALLLDGTGIERLPPACLRRQASFLREKAELIRTYNVGTALVINSSLLRALLRTLLALAPMPCEFRVFPDAVQGLVWCRARVAVATSPRVNH